MSVHVGLGTLFCALYEHSGSYTWVATILIDRTADFFLSDGCSNHEEQPHQERQESFFHL